MVNFWEVCDGNPRNKVVMVMKTAHRWKNEHFTLFYLALKGPQRHYCCWRANKRKDEIPPPFPSQPRTNLEKRRVQIKLFVEFLVTPTWTPQAKHVGEVNHPWEHWESPALHPPKALAQNPPRERERARERWRYRERLNTALLSPRRCAGNERGSQWRPGPARGISGV